MYMKYVIYHLLICLLVAFAHETVAKLVPRLVRNDGVQQPLIDSLFARVNQVNIQQFTLNNKQSQYMYCNCSLQYSTVQYIFSTVQYSTVQYILRHSTVQYTTLHYTTLHVHIQYMFGTAYM